MTDYFVYSGNNFLPTYNPGIIGYGQRGSNGDTGANGASVYYSSYDLTGNAGVDGLSPDQFYVLKCIYDGKELSNNLDISCKDAGYETPYMVNDIIVDRTASFYRIVKIPGEEAFVIDPVSKRITLPSDPFTPIDDAFGGPRNTKAYIKAGVKFTDYIVPCNTTSGFYSDVTYIFTGFKVSCTTSFVDESDKRWVQDNPVYDSESAELYLGSYSPKVYHHKFIEKNIYGNFIKFSLVHAAGYDISKYTYKFVLGLPDGRTLEKYSSSPATTIFVENSLLFGCFDTNGWANMFDFCLGKLDSSTDISDLSPDISKTIKLGDVIKYNGSKGIKNGEGSLEAAAMCSYFIRHNCTAYAEIVNIETGTIYRIDLGDIFIRFDANANLVENDTQSNVIGSVNKQSKWKTELYNEYDSGAFITDDNGNLFYPMNNFLMMVDKESDKFHASNDGIIEKVYFVDSNGLAKYTQYIEEGSAPLYKTDEDELVNEEFSNWKAAESMDDEYVSNIFNEVCKYIADNDLHDYVTGSFTYPVEDTSLDSMHKFLSDNLGTVIRHKYGVSPFTRVKKGGFTSYADCNRTAKLIFSNVSTLTINVVFTNYHEDVDEKLKDSFVNSGSPSDLPEYPNAVIYIGGIDTKLINLEEDSSSGYIAYMTKLVPPGYFDENDKDDNLQITYAGVADVTVNLEEYGFDPEEEHFIEIGIALIGTEGKSRQDLNTQHRTSTPNINGNKAGYSFLNPQDSGVPDIQIFIGSVKEAADNYESVDEGDEETGNIFNNIHKDTPVTA